MTKSCWSKNSMSMTLACSDWHGQFSHMQKSAECVQWSIEEKRLCIQKYFFSSLHNFLSYSANYSRSSCKFSNLINTGAQNGLYVSILSFFECFGTLCSKWDKNIKCFQANFPHLLIFLASLYFVNCKKRFSSLLSILGMFSK